MKAAYIGEKQGGVITGKGFKRAILISILIHTIMFLALFQFKGSMPSPNLIEVDIVNDRGIGDITAPMVAIEAVSYISPEKNVVRKPLRYVKTTMPLVDKSVVTEEQSLQKSVRSFPITQVTSEVHPQFRESTPFKGSNYQMPTPPLYVGEFSGDRGGGLGEGGRGEKAAHKFKTMVIQRIESAKIYPERARRRGIEGDVFVRFTVFPDGTVDGIEVTTDSRCHALLKLAAVKTIQRAAPYLPAPPMIKEGVGLRMQVKVSFHLS